MSDQDIVAKLRDGSRRVTWTDDRVRLQAAAEIERLSAELEEANETTLLTELGRDRTYARLLDA